MKCTLLLTRQCNLQCKYCYVGKNNASMPIEHARQIVDLVYQRAPDDEHIDFAFFGGEPLIEFEKLRLITEIIEQHPKYDPDQVRLTLVTNGTIFNDAIAEFVSAHQIALGISCDGPEDVHDMFRQYPGGKGSSKKVENTIRNALDSLPNVMVNAVYRPETIHALPKTIDYFSELGVKQIYLSPDFSAPWTEQHASNLEDIYSEIGDRYVEFYKHNDSHFISLIDSKIAVILRGGYAPQERCRMGTGELAFTPDGAIYPCERLVGNTDQDTRHCIGHIDDHTAMIPVESLGLNGDSQPGCAICSLKDYCMNWCGCTNYFGTGSYKRVSPFLCASERASIHVAMNVFQKLENEMEGIFYDHASSSPLINSACAMACQSQ